jgi:hypothetical protein
MHEPIEVYIARTRAERTSHLVLDSPCTTIGGDSRMFKGLLAHHLMTTIPDGMRKIHLCHACNNRHCSNVRHLYWGTASDNVKDTVANGKHPAGARRRRTIEEFESIFKVIDQIPKKHGWITQASKILDVPPASARGLISRWKLSRNVSEVHYERPHQQRQSPKDSAQEVVLTCCVECLCETGSTKRKWLRDRELRSAFDSLDPQQDALPL